MSAAATLRLVLASAILGSAIADASAAPAAACGALTAQDAAALMGAPLEVELQERTPPTS